MSNWELKILTAEVERLVELASRDGEIRREIREVAESILTRTEPASRIDPSPIVEPKPSEAPEPLHRLTLGQPSAQSSSPPKRSAEPVATDVIPDNLESLAQRFRTKAEAARLAADRVLATFSPETRPSTPEQDASSSDVNQWANSFENAHYWNDQTEPRVPSQPCPLDSLADSYEALAAATQLTSDARADVRLLGRCLPLLAEAQSALREAHRRACGTIDPDQVEVFEWLKLTAARYRVFLPRFMRADDKADPTRAADLLHRIEAQADRTDPRGRSARADQLVAQLRQTLPASMPRDLGVYDWQPVVRGVEQLLADGFPPSYPPLRDALAPFVDEIPENPDYPAGFQRVLREVDRYLATRPVPQADSHTHSWSVAVSDVAARLRGRAVVLIGGNRRRDAQSSLMRAFELAELIWLQTKEHQAVSTFEPTIARGAVAVVLLAIRWSSHSFGEVRHLCERHGKLLVRLPGGYGVNQVAEQILAQAGDQIPPA